MYMAELASLTTVISVAGNVVSPCLRWARHVTLKVMKRYLWTVCAVVALCAPAMISLPAFADQAALGGKSTGVLDLQLADAGNGQFFVRNKTYSVAFPAKPSVSPQDTPTAAGEIKGALALQTTDAAGNLGNGFMLVPIPKDVPYDAKAGVKAARDGMLNVLKGKIIKEQAMDLAGIKATKTMARGTVQGQALEVNMWIGFDTKNRALVGLFTIRESGKSDGVQAFVDGFQVTGNATLVDAGGIEKTGFHNVTIAPQSGDKYLLTGEGYSIVYPTKPTFSTFDVPWPTGATKAGSAMADQGESAHGVVITYVPDGIVYDAKKGLDGARDKMLEGMKAKLVSEKAATLGGVAGRVVYGSLAVGGKQATVRTHFAYYPKRRLVFGVMSLWVSGDKKGEINANLFLKSLKMKK